MDAFEHHPWASSNWNRSFSFLQDAPLCREAVERSKAKELFEQSLVNLREVAYREGWSFRDYLHLDEVLQQEKHKHAFRHMNRPKSEFDFRNMRQRGIQPALFDEAETEDNSELPQEERDDYPLG